MDPRFAAHNSHVLGLDRFIKQDPHLYPLSQLKYVFEPELLNKLPRVIPGIYTLGGGPQIGKTTLCKLWMVRLLETGVKPENIAFFSGELIDDFHSLLKLLQDQLSTMPSASLRYLIIDEITYINGWEKAIKYAADAGLFVKVIVMLTGSDLSMMQEARITFPGRRGKADVVDFHIYPLSFREVIELKKIFTKKKNIKQVIKKPSQSDIRILYKEFNQYLMHGGYLTAINDLAEFGEIKMATLSTYSDWIRGDVVKRGKHESSLKEILSAILKRYSSQITWNAIIDDLSINHPQTVIEYCALLEKMDALFIQYVLAEDKLLPAYKKAKKLWFTDPFIFHAIRAWLNPISNPFQEQIKTAIEDPKLSAALVEACVVTHYRRYYPTYFIKAEGEIDVAYLFKNRFWPIEVKWRTQMRPKDLKQIVKYKNSRIFAKIDESSDINGVEAIPLPLALLELAEK